MDRMSQQLNPETDSDFEAGRELTRQMEASYQLYQDLFGDEVETSLDVLKQRFLS